MYLLAATRHADSNDTEGTARAGQKGYILRECAKAVLERCTRSSSLDRTPKNGIYVYIYIYIYTSLGPPHLRMRSCFVLGFYIVDLGAWRLCIAGCSDEEGHAYLCVETCRAGQLIQDILCHCRRQLDNTMPTQVRIAKSRPMRAVWL